MTSGKHLDSVIHNNENNMARNPMEKRAAYINKNNGQMTEFEFAHSETTSNTAFYGSVFYGSVFYGSVLWDETTGKDMELYTKTNATTHRFFIEHLTGTKHVIFN